MKQTRWLSEFSSLSKYTQLYPMPEIPPYIWLTALDLTSAWNTSVYLTYSTRSDLSLKYLDIWLTALDLSSAWNTSIFDLQH